MPHLVQHSPAGEGPELTAPDGVLSPATTFLVVRLTGAIGRFRADLDATVPRGVAVEHAALEIQQVLGRHDVSVAGLEGVR